jgi:hypothetical protein
MGEGKLWRITLCSLFASVAAWVYHFRSVFLSPDTFLPRDSYLFHWRIFDYVAQYLKFQGEFPDWDFRYGISLIPFGNNFLLFMPYRWVGYALVAFFGVDSVVAYKISFLLVGQGLFLWGIFLFHRTLLKSRWAGLLAVVISLLSSLSFGLFHQEQMLGTLFFIPWVGWAALKAKDESRWWPLVFALIGYSLNCHYPQLLFVFYGLVLFTIPPTFSSRKVPRTFLWPIVLLGVAMGPLVYSYARYNGTLRSSFRDQKVSIEATSFEEYDRVNRLGPSSVYPENFSLFLQTKFAPPPAHVGDMDYLSFHATLAFPLALLLSLFVVFPYRRFILFMLAGLALSAIGIHGPMPKLFWYVVPGIRLFRQYYHFLPIFTLMAVVLTTVAIFQMSRRWKWAGAALLSVALVSGGLQTLWATERVEARLIPRTVEPAEPESAEVFFQRALFEFPLGSPLAMPKDAKLPTFDVMAKRYIPWWEMQDGEKITVMPGTLGGLPTMLISDAIPPRARSITFLQYDDGNWLGPLEKTESRLMTISVDNLRKGVSLQRKKTAWPYLILLMIASVAGAFYKRKKAGSSAPSPISTQKLSTITDVAG